MSSCLQKVRQLWVKYAAAEDGLVKSLSVPECVDSSAFSVRCRPILAKHHVSALHVHVVFSGEKSSFVDEDWLVMNVPQDDYAAHLSKLKDLAYTMSWWNQLAADVADYRGEHLAVF